MLAINRHQKILEKLEQYGTVKVSELSETFQVTEKTIREDLEKLERKNLLKRIHGGAVLPEDKKGVSLVPPVPNIAMMQEKRAIAEKAVQYIEKEDIIALDGGSTTLEIAKKLGNVPLTVVTNDLMILRELAVHDQIRLIVPGGSRDRNMLVHPMASEWVRELNIHKVFLSCTGIHMEYGLTVFSNDHVALKKMFVEAAKKIICVADHTKFDRGALLTFAELKDIDLFITDRGLDLEMRTKYAQQTTIEFV